MKFLPNSIWRFYTLTLAVTLIGVSIILIYVWNKTFYATSLVVLILSKPEGLLRREILRNTFMEITQVYVETNHVNIKYYFIIGNEELPTNISTKLKLEQLTHNDILFVPVKDNYNNLTIKMMQAYNWLYTNQGFYFNFDYVMKLDDDIFVNIVDLVKELIKIESKYLQLHTHSLNLNTKYMSVNIQSNEISSGNKYHLYWGYMYGNSNIYNIGKYMENNWILCDVYIPYALGGGYVLSKGLIEYLARNKNYFRYYHSEDVSVGAWLAPVNNIVRIHDRRFDTEYVSRGCQNYYLIRHNVSPDEMKEMYKNLKENHQLCVKEERTVKEYLYDWSVQPTKCCDRTL